MLKQTLIHTPMYVWAILAFLLYRGVVASKDRVVSYRSVFIIPVLMAALGLQSIASRFGLNGVQAAAWLAGVVTGSLLAWKLLAGQRVVVDRVSGTLRQRGSWIPLCLMMAIFFCKYAVAAGSAIHPEWLQDMQLVVGSCVVFGLFNGVFIGRLLQNIAAYYAGPSGQTVPTAG